MKVAILPWGDVFEAYLETISTSIDTFATRMEGGWLFGYVDALSKVGADSLVIVVSRDADVPRKIQNTRTGCTTIVLPSPKSYQFANRLPPALAERIAPYLALPEGPLEQVLREEDCTHVMMQEYEDARFDRLIPLARRLGISATASFQGGQIEPSTILGRMVRRRSIRNADGLIIASSVEATRVAERYGTDLRVATIFNPVDSGIWYPEDRSAARAALQIPESARVAICHCRIDIQRKGIDILLDAWRESVRREPDMDLRLHLIGDGQDRETLKDDLARAPAKGLHWFDKFNQDRAEMRRHLSAADLHVQASRHEGFAVAPLEAMACGLPTVLSRAPGASDLLNRGEQSGGLLVPIGDAPALADALLALLTDDTRRARAAVCAKRRVESAAGMEAVGKQLTEFLSSETLAV